MCVYVNKNRKKRQYRTLGISFLHGARNSGLVCELVCLICVKVFKLSLTSFLGIHDTHTTGILQDYDLFL